MDYTSPLQQQKFRKRAVFGAGLYDRRPGGQATRAGLAGSSATLPPPPAYNPRPEWIRMMRARTLRPPLEQEEV